MDNDIRQELYRYAKIIRKQPPQGKEGLQEFKCIIQASYSLQELDRLTLMEYALADTILTALNAKDIFHLTSRMAVVNLLHTTIKNWEEDI